MMKTKVTQETRATFRDHGAVPECKPLAETERVLAKLRSCEGVKLL